MSSRRTVGAFAALVLAFALVLPIAGANASPAGKAQTGGGEEDRWTFLYYVDADNDIEAGLLEDVERMAAAGSTDDVNVVALVDRSPDDTSYESGDGPVEDAELLNLEQFDDAKLLHVQKGEFEVLQELGEIDMGDVQTWSWFLTTGIEMFPAEHYVAVIDDHGGGISGAAWDHSSDPVTNLTMKDITDGLKAALSETDVEKLDLLAFNACLMSNFDVAAKVAPYADTMLASEEVTLDRQWNDTAMINVAINDEDAEAADLAQAILDNQDAVADFYPIRTYSIIDLTKINLVKSALDSFSNAMVDNIEDTATELGRAQSKTIEFGRIDAETAFGLYDLGDLIAHLENMPDEVQTAANAVYAAVEQATIAIESGEAAVAATGLSVFFPLTASDVPNGYDQFSASPGWADLLTAYFDNAADPDDNGNSGDGSGPEFETGEVTFELFPDGVLGFADLVLGTEGSVIDAFAACGTLTADGNVEYYLFEPAFIGAGEVNTIAAGWDFGYLQLVDDQAALNATTLLDPVEGGIRASIPVVYQATDGTQSDGLIQFTFFDDGEVTDPVIVSFDEEGGVAELFVEPGSLIAPLVLVVTPGGDVGYQLVSDQGIDAVNYGLSFTLLAPGSPFVMTLGANDAAGNQALATGSDIVPNPEGEVPVGDTGGG